MLLRNKIEIENWLNKYEVKNYKIIPNKEYGYVVDVDGSVDLFNRELQNIKVKFNIVKGFFDCCDNRLISLEENTDKSVGCPEIVNGNFFCDKNNLESIKGSPKIVKQIFNCSKNKLTSLEGCPEEINGSFYGEYNNLKLINMCNDLIINKN